MALTDIQQSWINTLVHGLNMYNKEGKVLNSLIIAQGILESGWGSSSLCIRSRNIFGVKAFRSTDAFDEYKTKEQRSDGSEYTITARFRRYDSFDDAIKDQVLRFTNPAGRYMKLIGEKDYKNACRIVRECGYATDINYTNKLINIIEQYDLTKYDINKSTLVNIQFSNEITGVSGIIPVEAINVNGYNYIKLRELSKFGIEVDYIAEKNLPTVLIKK